MKPRIPQFIPPSAKKRIKKKLVPAEEWDKKMEDKYKLVDPEKEQNGDTSLAKEKVVVRITKGTYTGVEFYYGAAQLLPQQENGNTPIKFEYTVTKKPPKVKTDTQTFIDFAGDVLLDMFEKQLKAGTLKWEPKKAEEDNELTTGQGTEDHSSESST